jgi:hypothetical protein
MRILISALWLLLNLSVSGPALAQAANNLVEANAANANASVATNSRDAATPAAQRATQPPAAPSASPPNANDPHVLPESGQAIVKLFVLAVLLESALALLFNWRPFVVYFDGRAVKPVVSLVVALVVVFAFGLTDLETLLRAYGGDPMTGEGATICRIIEAMIIAGGSSGVNTLLRNLGFRAIPTQEQPTQRPPKTDAWLAVGLHRVQAVGPVQVEIAPRGTIGSITGSMRKPGWRSFLLRDTGRLPASGGMTVEPNVKYTVSVSGEDVNHNALPAPPSQVVTLAPGAVVDLEFTL